MPDGPSGYIAIALIVVGALGALAQTVRFVRVTLPANYGANPGFGAYEVTVIPWLAVGCVGVALSTTWLVGLSAFLVLTIGSGLFAQLLAVLARRFR